MRAGDHDLVLLDVIAAERLESGSEADTAVVFHRSAVSRIDRDREG